MNVSQPIHPTVSPCVSVERQPVFDDRHVFHESH